ncbi:uncharacterized protein Dwil_GK19240 [Drosophila willistoni]|uniref:APOPT family protein CG14806, mitochondrial n=1 Tax=Drosophila willistoni TaxID=7260 RepID=B4N1V9_DROWI|nr:COA8 family protein CG14806, mitochondrial [Drosophila willistoni]EDW78348.2 uncharacterized protein Dwil_GK19240 [Drosophila willistoni]
MHKCLTLALPVRKQISSPFIKHYVTAAPRRRPKVVQGALAERPDPHAVKCDYIGPPDKLSNLRPYVRHIDKNETELAKKLRLKQLEVEAWNIDFWTRHNKRFYDEKADFIRLHKINVNETDDTYADRMSVFYKTFLDKNRRLHIMYNISWYIKNFDMLVLAFMVSCQKLFAIVKRYGGKKV